MHPATDSSAIPDRFVPYLALRPGTIVEEAEVIRYVDERYARAFGYASPSSLIGRHISIVIASEDRPRLLEFGTRRSHGSEAPQSYAFRGRRADGVDLAVDVTVKSLAVEGTIMIASELAADPRPFSRTNDLDLESIYAEHSPIVYAFLLRMLNHRDEACDVLQETFIQAWRELGKFEKSRGSICGWLITIARTRALDRLRAAKTRGRYEAASRSSTSAVEPTFLHDVDALKAKTALASIPLEQRRVLELAYFGDLSHTQIAQELALPLGTVKTRIALGMRKLREQLRCN